MTGASGSGTSTLGEALAHALDARWGDLDDLYWEPTTPPFQTKRDHETRSRLMRAELRASPRLIASGSLMKWGTDIENAFDLIVFLSLASDIRVARLRAREAKRLGHVDEDFIAWAAQYDEGTFTGRSRKLHEAWLAERSTSRVLRLDGAMPTADQVSAVVAAVT